MDGAGMETRGSPRLNPHFQASGEGARVTPLRGGGRRRRRTSPAADASLPDDDDMLREILLRLPPQPSSLPRASAVCTRWRRLVTDPKFHRQFYAHHQKPLLLGVFEHRSEGIVFIPILDPPDRIPLVRMSLGRFLNCHHGLVLVHDFNQHEVVVCDPITGDARRVAVPMKFRMNFDIVGAVLCAASDHGHVHGGCHLSPFKLVLVSSQRPDCRPLASVYSSETGLWGNLISIEATCQTPRPTVLVGSYLYWFSYNGILEFDLAKNSLTMIGLPPVTNRFDYYENSQIIEAENGVVGLAILSHHRFQLWKRTVNAHGVATLVPWKAIEMHSIPGLSPLIDGDIEGCMKAYDEDTDTIFLHAGGNVYGVQLKLMQSRKLYESEAGWHDYYCYPFKSFYTPGEGMAAAVLTESVA